MRSAARRRAPARMSSPVTVTTAPRRHLTHPGFRSRGGCKPSPTPIARCADRASLDLLRFVARGIDEAPLLLVATYRAEEIDRRHPLAALVPLLVREAPTERLGLRPLDTAAAQELVRARHDLAEPAVQRLSAYLIERTEGHPLFPTELLRSLEEERLIERIAQGASAQAIAQTPVPLLLRQIVDDRLSRLSDETAALLTIAAVAGEGGPPAGWGGGAGGGGGDLP